MDLQPLLELNMGNPNLLDWSCSDETLMEEAPVLLSNVNFPVVDHPTVDGIFHDPHRDTSIPMHEVVDDDLFVDCLDHHVPVVHQYTNPAMMVVQEDCNYPQFTMVDTSELFLHGGPPCSSQLQTDTAVQINVDAGTGGMVAPGYESFYCSGGDSVDAGNCCSYDGGRASKSSSIGFEEISKCFYMTITDAAKEMKVGLTVLKKRCRELGISRWPHRKMKSLSSLIHNVQELEGGSGDVNIQREIESLEENRRLMEKMPELELSERTKKLRQACFKANYKRRRAAEPPPPYLSPCPESS